MWNKNWNCLFFIFCLAIPPDFSLYSASFHPSHLFYLVPPIYSPYSAFPPCFLSLFCLIPPIFSFYSALFNPLLFSLPILLYSACSCYFTLICHFSPSVFSPYSASFHPCSLLSLYSTAFPLFSLPILSQFLYFLSLFCFVPPCSTSFHPFSLHILPNSPSFSFYFASFNTFLFSLFILLHSTCSCFFSLFCLFPPSVFSPYSASVHPCFLSLFYRIPPVFSPYSDSSPHFISLFCFIPLVPVFSLFCFFLPISSPYIFCYTSSWFHSLILLL